MKKSQSDIFMAAEIPYFQLWRGDQRFIDIEF